MVYRAAGPQRLAYVSHGHDWVPTDFDGLTLMLRPNPTSAPRREGDGPEHLHWSAAARLRSEERRVGKERSSRWPGWEYIEKRNRLPLAAVAGGRAPYCG